MTLNELKATVLETFPGGNMLPISVFRDWFTDILIPQLWREPGGGGGGTGPAIIYGTQDPNTNPPSEPYTLGYLYGQTIDGTETGEVLGLYQYNGDEWVPVASISDSNFVLFTAQNKSEPEKKIARNNIGLDFDENNIDPLEMYLLQIES